ncbi:MAG: hypothetical protein WKF37_04470 [Bryobacteraceae bacterium]
MALVVDTTMGNMNRGGTAVRNAEGAFEIAGLAPGSYALMAHKMGGG